LKRAEEIRLVADYKGDSVELRDAREMVAQAETFVNAMHVEFMSNDPNNDNYGVKP
jgi:quinolinate synthase